MEPLLWVDLKNGYVWPVLFARMFATEELRLPMTTTVPVG